MGYQLDSAPELERTYERQLNALAQVRREVAEVVTLRKCGHVPAGPA